MSNKKLFEIYKSVQSDYEKGFSKNELQEKYNKSIASINKCLNFGKHRDFEINGLSRDVFLYEYWNNKLESKEIASKYNISISKLSYIKTLWGVHLTQFDKNKRLKSSMSKDQWIEHNTAHLKGVHKDRWKKKKITQSYLYQKYVIEGLSKDDIADILVMNTSTLDKWFDYYNLIPLSKSDLIKRNKANSLYYCDKFIDYNKNVLSLKIILKDVKLVIDDDNIKYKFKITDSVRTHIVLTNKSLLENYIRYVYKSDIKPKLIDFYDDCVLNSDINGYGYKTFKEKMNKLNNLECFIDGYTNPYSSKFEEMIGDYLLKKDYSFDLHDRNVLNGLELDFYLKSNKKAIEFNSLTFHASNQPKFNHFNSKDFSKSKYYHQNKLLQTYINNINLLHVYEFEVRTKQQRDLMKKRINSFLSDKLLTQTLMKKKIRKRRCLEFLKNHSVWEYYLYYGQDDDMYYGLFDNNSQMQMVYIKNKKNEIKHVVSAYNYRYSSLLDVLIEYEPNSKIFSNLEFGIYNQIDYTLITEPKYLDCSNKGIILKKDDYRYLSNKFYRIYNSGYQIINT